MRKESMAMGHSASRDSQLSTLEAQAHNLCYQRFHSVLMKGRAVDVRISCFFNALTVDEEHGWVNAQVEETGVQKWVGSIQLQGLNSTNQSCRGRTTALGDVPPASTAVLIPEPSSRLSSLFLITLLNGPRATVRAYYCSMFVSHFAAFHIN